MTTVADLTPVVLIYDTAAGSPADRPDLAALNGKELLVEPQHIPLPAGGMFYGQPGYSRQVGPAWQWVLTGGDPNSQLDVFLDSLTGLGHWEDQTARAVWRQAVQRQRQEGLPRQLIQQMASGQFNAARNEIIAEQRTEAPAAEPG